MPDDVEQWFAGQVDDGVGQSFDLIEQVSTAFASSDRLRVATFLAALDMRTPRSRDWLQPWFEQALRSAIADEKAAQRGLFWEHGRIVPLDEIRAVAAETAEGLVADQLPTSWLEYIKRTMPLATHRVARGEWNLVCAPLGTEFVTSDLAVAKLSDLTTFVPHNFGFIGEISHWAVPISPKHALLISGEPGEGAVFEAEHTWVSALNSRLAEDTSRFVYARSRIDPTALFPRAAS